MSALRSAAASAAFLFALVGPVPASDWPQWMGPNRDGVWPESGIVDSFPKEGPKKLWSMPVSLGYAGPAVAKGRVYVPDFIALEGDVKNGPAAKVKLTGTERLHCLEAATGKSLWVDRYDCKYDLSYPSGPRCTPTVDGDRVYTVGAMGDLRCLNAESGSLVWSKSFAKDYGAETPIWGYAGHPLVYGDQVICLVGGKDALVVSFDKKTGKEAWKSLDAKEPGYAPPVVIEAGGKSQLIIYHPTALVSLDPATGKPYWTHEVKPMYAMSIMAPQRDGDTLFAGNMFAGIAVTLHKTEPKAELNWAAKRTNALTPVNMTPLIHESVMYGCDQPGVFRAVSMKDGRRLWATMLPVTGRDVAETNVGSGTAFVVRNGDRYFLFGETGDLILAKMTPESYTEVSRARILEPTGEAFGRKVVWSHPAFANGCVFARNDKEIVCLSLKK
jgi:outer membrane protein assembly factor BamB